MMPGSRRAMMGLAVEPAKREGEGNERQKGKPDQIAGASEPVGATVISPLASGLQHLISSIVFYFIA